MKYVILLFSTLILLSCENSKRPDEKCQNSHLFVLDLDKSLAKDTLHASSFIASVTPIALETTDDNMIGFISAMQITDTCICILDGGPGSSGSLFVFNKKGKYLRQIGKRGQGPGEYNTIRDFTIDEKGDKIFLVDSDLEKISVYQFSTGLHLQDINFKNNKVEQRNIQYANNKLFTDVIYYKKTEEGPMVYVLNETTGDIEATFLDINLHNHGWLNSFSKGESNFYCKNSEKPKYTHYFMDTVMVVDNDALVPYLVVKSKNWVTDLDVKGNKNTTNNPEEDAFLKIQEQPIAFFLQNYVESDRYIYFVYCKQRNYLTVVYDKDNDHLLHTSVLIDDMLFNGGVFPILSITCGDEKGMYGIINTNAIPSFCNLLNNSTSIVKPEFRDFLKVKITPESNPVILYYEHKK